VESAEELLTALLGQDGTLEPLKRVLIERAQGNPFFLEESVQTLVETRVLVGNRGAYRMTRAPEEWPIPATAQAIVAARIDRLPPEDKRLLQAASIIGRDVPFTLLQAIADVPQESLRPALAHLQDSEFLYETSVFLDIEYTFKHALTHEVTYASVLHDRRRLVDARIVEAIETLHPDRITEQVERLAHHAFRGEVWEKAVTYLRQAGAKALARSAYRDAVTRFEQGLVALNLLPDTREKVERAIDLRLELRQALFPLNELAAVWRYLQEAEEQSRPERLMIRDDWVGVGLYERSSPAHWRSRHGGAYVCAEGRSYRRASRRCSAPDRSSSLPCLRLPPLRQLSRDRTCLPQADAIATRPRDP
jgi:predicted ATPase